MSLSKNIERASANVLCMLDEVKHDIKHGNYQGAREAAELLQMESAELMALVAELERRHR